MTVDPDFAKAQKHYGKKAGDEAFSRLVRRHQSGLIAQIYASVHDRDRALELAQEALLKAYKALPKARPDTRFRAWIGSIARNLCIDEARRHAKPKSLDRDVGSGTYQLKDLIQDSQAGPAQTAMQKEAITRLRSCLESLRPIDREILELRQFQQLSYTEIAEILKCSEKAAKQRMYQALQALKKKFKKSADP